MKKRILFTMPSMFMGGAERSLLGLLDAIDYNKYDVELFLYRHEGEFLEFINPKVTIIPEINKYKTFDVPIVSLIKSKLYLFGISRIISKIFLKLHCLLSKEKEGVWMHMQYTSRFLQWILPNIPGEYDCAISFLGVPDVLVNKINAKTKIAWIHTDYDTLNNVIILGKKINPYPYIKNCDLYVQPSRYEGKAVTVREAQMLCKPVVITKFATSSSQLKDGYDGIIVPMDNQGCADGIAKLLNNKVLMQQLSENCAENDYSNSQEINKIYEIIETS